MKDLLFFTILGFCCFIALIYCNVYAHELVHKRIFEEYGIDASIEIDFFGGKTIPIDDYFKLTPKERAEMSKLHIMNDIFGYQIESLLAGIYVFYVLFLVFFQVKTLKNKS